MSEIWRGTSVNAYDRVMTCALISSVSIFIYLFRVREINLIVKMFADFYGKESVIETVRERIHRKQRNCI